MIVRRAACSCGKLAVTTRGEPIRVSICHCLACQRRTGSVFAVQARFATENVEVEGIGAEYVRVGDAGSTARFRFCASCGSTVYYTLDEMPGSAVVPVGAFADPRFPQPSFSVYEERKHPWVMLPEPIEHLD